VDQAYDYCESAARNNLLKIFESMLFVCASAVGVDVNNGQGLCLDAKKSGHDRCRDAFPNNTKSAPKKSLEKK
jgi:hypothetical protein